MRSDRLRLKSVKIQAIAPSCRSPIPHSESQLLAYRLGRYLEQKINETLACIVVDAQGREIYAKPFRDYISEENRDTFLTLLGASAFVLLIAARKCHGTFPGANRSAAPRDCDPSRSRRLHHSDRRSFVD